MNLVEGHVSEHMLPIYINISTRNGWCLQRPSIFVCVYEYKYNSPGVVRNMASSALFKTVTNLVGWNRDNLNFKAGK